MSVKEAIEGYLKWTNRLFSCWRANSNKRGELWSYVQVTEWQKRGHPHSHILTTWCPEDLIIGSDVIPCQRESFGVTDETMDKLRSAYIRKSVISAGLGYQYDISQVFTIEGASRYVAKYLFKKTMFSRDYPEKWRRVRYSQSFPKLESKPNKEAFPLLSRADWELLARKAVILECIGDIATKEAEYQLKGSDCIIQATGERL